MPQLLKVPSLTEAERAKYQNVEFSDMEVEVLLRYFDLTSHDDLKSLLEVKRKSLAMTN